jgi:hypothetical protein
MSAYKLKDGRTRHNNWLLGGRWIWKWRERPLVFTQVIIAWGTEIDCGNNSPWCIMVMGGKSIASLH